MDLKEGNADEAANHWYYRHKWKIVERSLRRHSIEPSVVKDVGSGSGYFARQFLALWSESTVYAIDSFYNKDQIGIHHGVNFENDLSATPPGDFYSLMDVLEHVDDDLGFLKKCVEEAKPDSEFLLTVPAFMALWSPHDVFLGHFRRYRIGQFKELATKAGLEIIDSRYTFAPLFIPVLLIRNINRILAVQPKSDLKKTNTVIGKMIGAILQFELLLPSNSFFGLSILLLARKA